MIIVCPLHRAERLITEHGAGHAVSLLGPATPHPTFAALDPARHLRLTFHDIVEPMEDYSAPGRDDVARLVEFLGGWDRRDPILIHCWAGISRSTAAAYTALCMFRPRASEDVLARELRQASPSATPNRLIVALADEILGRGGRMTRAIEGIGRGAEAAEGQPFTLPTGD
jgi:predicted protein tyrosine phosphatase